MALHRGDVYPGLLTDAQISRLFEIRNRLWEMAQEKEEAYSCGGFDWLCLLDAENDQLQAEIDEIRVAGLQQANILPTP